MREESNPHYARQVLPLRAAVIEASFPYRAQLEEFRDKLRLDSTWSVLEEMTTDPSDPNGTQRPAFRFLRVEVARRFLV